jgi:tetratricopeptide (TPR) repeat protein
MKECMRIAKIVMLAAVCVALAPAFLLNNASAQQKGGVKGVVHDDKGKPVPGVKIQLQLNDGTPIELTTDDNGKFAKGGLQVGTYTITYSIPNVPDVSRPLKIVAGIDTDGSLNLNDPAVEAYIKARKAEAEEESKFGKMKAHFDAGATALKQEQGVHDQFLKAASDQKPALQDQLNQNEATALNEFKEAVAATQPTDVNNLTALYNNMGSAADLAGKYDEAAGYYQQSATLKADAGVYNNMGLDLAKADKFDDAKAAFEKSAQLDPTGAARAYRNFGAVAYNAGKLPNPAVVEVLKKATELDPKNAQGWYLYATFLAAAIETKQEGDKIIMTPLPGTIEAYQTCIDVDPNGPFAAQAKDGLEALKSMGVPIDTKVTVPKTKH